MSLSHCHSTCRCLSVSKCDDRVWQRAVTTTVTFAMFPIATRAELVTSKTLTESAKVCHVFVLCQEHCIYVSPSSSLAIHKAKHGKVNVSVGRSLLFVKYCHKFMTVLGSTIPDVRGVFHII